MAKLVRHLTSNEEIVSSNLAEGIFFLIVFFLTFFIVVFFLSHHFFLSRLPPLGYIDIYD
ncbi:unnamed protein product [Debaryomyces tyrocola]|nr:unnamed protein product [Debaryomyces tyrocola]